MRDAGPNEKNHTSVKAAFQGAVARASAATVRISADGQPAALGAVVGADGYVVTKASVLGGELKCRSEDGVEVAAEIVGVNENYDLALLRVAADGLTPVAWRTDDVPPPGSLVATVGPGDTVLAVGVIGADPRRIDGPTRPEGQRGWLGIGLGDGDAGLGITMVFRGSAAEKAGLEVGDRVKSIDGVTMKSVDHVVETVGGHAFGDAIKLLIQRGEEEVEMAATLGKSRPRRDPKDSWGGGPFSPRRGGFPVGLPHDTVVHPDLCGGPLVDTDGNVVGINIARALRVATYAIPADVVKEVLQDLQSGEPAAQKD
jgi:serine protease Do